MGFQVCFKSVGFFLIFKGNSIFDPPWTEFCGMRHITFVMFFKAGFQVFGTADVKMCPGCFVNENVNVMKVGHKRKSFRITFGIMLCRIARLPSSCFALRHAKSAMAKTTVELHHRNIARLTLQQFSLWLAKSQKCSLIKALPQWVFKYVSKA